MPKCNHPLCINALEAMCRCPAPDFCHACQKRGNKNNHAYPTLHYDAFEKEKKSISVCTFPETQRSYTNQWWIRCSTCGDTSNEGGCLYCRKSCLDSKHDMVIRYSSFFCDVGARAQGSTPVTCQICNKEGHVAKKCPTFVRMKDAIDQCKFVLRNH